MEGNIPAHANLPLDSHVVATEFATLVIADIVVDTSINPRSKLDQGFVKKLKRALLEGASLGRPLVFIIENQFVLVDGFARVAAFQEAGVTHIEVEIRPGTKREAIVEAIRINVKHGRTLNNLEKKNAINAILDDPAEHQFTDSELSEKSGCSPPMVAKYRKLHPLSPNFLGQPRNARTRHGGRRSLDISRLGSRKGKTDAESAVPVANDAGGNARERTDQNEPEAGAAPAAGLDENSPIDHPHDANQDVVGFAEQPDPRRDVATSPVEAKIDAALIAQELRRLMSVLGNAETVGATAASSVEPTICHDIKKFFKWVADAKTIYGKRKLVHACQAAAVQRSVSKAASHAQR